jgi:uncharacterized membrane-anchored protein YhcB (DUF1043 family)
MSAQGARHAGPAVPTSPLADLPHPILEHLRSAMILDYATFLVAIITLIFTIFVGIFAVREWQKFVMVKKELAAQRAELSHQREGLEKQLRAIAEQRSELAAEGRRTQDHVESFRLEMNAQEKRLANSQRFLEAVLSTQSSLLVGIVEGFGSALKPQDARQIGALIFEAESALYLFYPDNSEVLKALLKLEQVGSDSSVPLLVQLRDDPSAAGDLRVRAQQVLTTVKERIKKRKQAASTQPPVPAGSRNVTEVPMLDVDLPVDRNKGQDRREP